MRPCDESGAFDARRPSLLGLEYNVEAGQAGRECVHFRAHDAIDLKIGQSALSPRSGVENRCWFSRARGWWSMLMRSVYTVDSVVMRNANTRDDIMSSTPTSDSRDLGIVVEPAWDQFNPSALAIDFPHLRSMIRDCDIL